MNLDKLMVLAPLSYPVQYPPEDKPEKKGKQQDQDRPGKQGINGVPSTNDTVQYGLIEMFQIIQHKMNLRNSSQPHPGPWIDLVILSGGGVLLIRNQSSSEMFPYS
jgi:hypothetical protein